MDEHYALLDEGVLLTEALDAHDVDEAARLLQTFAGHLKAHVGKEEVGVFSALKVQGEFVEEVDELEQEHRELDAALAGLVVASPDFPAVLADLLRDLERHVERENLGIFPVSVVTLHATGWELVEQARERRPTFLEQGVGPVGRPSRP